MGDSGGQSEGWSPYGIVAAVVLAVILIAILGSIVFSGELGR
jgi:hypothetical protein